MFHVELRQFPHTARAFNLTREQVHARIVMPWLRREFVVLDSQQFAPERAKLKIYEGPELQTADLGMGRGWQNVMRGGEDVTERELQAAVAAGRAQAAATATATATAPAQAVPGAPATATESLDHVDLVVSSLERSLVFYGGLLGPLGFTRWTTITGERGERVVYLGRAGSHFAIGLRERQSDADGAYDRYALGIHHLALSAPSREAVDERARWLVEQGATIESGPKEHDYSPTYYAVFFYDPDGIKLELVHQ